MHEVQAPQQYPALYVMADNRKKYDNKLNKKQQRNEWKFIDKIKLLKRQMTNGIDYCRLELLKCHDKMTTEVGWLRERGGSKISTHRIFIEIDFEKRLHLKSASHLHARWYEKNKINYSSGKRGSGTDNCAHCLTESVTYSLSSFLLLLFCLFNSKATHKSRMWEQWHVSLFSFRLDCFDCCCWRQRRQWRRDNNNNSITLPFS